MTEVQEWDFNRCQCGHDKQQHESDPSYTWRGCLYCRCKAFNPMISTATNQPKKVHNQAGSIAKMQSGY